MLLELLHPLGSGPHPHRAEAQRFFFARETREHMPMDVRFEIAQAFVVQLERLDHGVDRLGHGANLIEERARLVARKLENLARMMLREQDAIAAIELRIAEHDEGMVQLRDEVGSFSGADVFEYRAD